jgi:nicotinamidase-related amidase
MNTQPKRAGTRTALLIVDMISDFEFDDGDKLCKAAIPAARKIAQLKQRAEGVGLPIIYVNDNYGKWQDDFARQVERIIGEKTRGHTIAELLRPAAEDYYVLKPQRSGFYETPLEVLLSGLGVGRLIITGVTTDICVLFTAHDAYMRGFKLSVPADCTAAVTTSHHRSALTLLKRAADTDTTISAKMKMK